MPLKFGGINAAGQGLGTRGRMGESEGPSKAPASPITGAFGKGATGKASAPAVGGRQKKMRTAIGRTVKGRSFK